MMSEGGNSSWMEVLPLYFIHPPGGVERLRGRTHSVFVNTLPFTKYRAGEA